MSHNTSWAIVGGHAPEAIYYYTDPNGAPIAAVARYAPGTLDPEKKSIRQYRYESGVYLTGLNGRELPLYRSADLLSDSERVVHVVEGEKCADLLSRYGLLATTNSGGAGKWREDLSIALTGRRVVIHPDDDDPGHKHALAVAASLQGKAAEVRVMNVLTPDSRPKGEGYDLADWFADGGTVAELERLIAATPPWTPPCDWGPTVAFQANQEPAPFPMEAALPPMLAEVASAIAEHSRVDPTAPAAVIPAVLSAAAGNAFRVRVSAAYVEPNLSRYVVWIKPSGERGTATMGLLINPIDRWSKAKEPYYLRRRQEAEMQARVRRKAADVAEGKASKAKGTKREEQLKAARETHSSLDLPPERFVGYLSDVTPEMLTRAMAGNGGACAILCGDARHFLDGVMGQYRGDGRMNDSLFLRAHGGDPIDRARIGKVPEGELLMILNPALAIGVAVQPDKFEELADSPQLISSGFLPRCHLVFPRSLVGTRIETGQEMPIDPRIRARWEQVVRRLLDQRETVLANVSDESWTPTELVLSTDAMELRRSFANEIEVEAGPNGSLRNIPAFGSKCAGEAARLAALLHLAECAYRDTFGTAGWQVIPAATWSYAEAFQRWQIAETLRVLGLSTEDAVTRKARRILTWLAKNPTKRTTIVSRDLIETHIVPTAADATLVLEWLAERNWVRPRKPEKGERSARWEVNPVVFGGGQS